MNDTNWDPDNRANGIIVHPGEIVRVPVGDTIVNYWSNPIVQNWLANKCDDKELTIHLDGGDTCWTHLANDFSAYPIIKAAASVGWGYSIGYRDPETNEITVSVSSLGYWTGDGLKQLATEMGNNGQYYFEFAENKYPSSTMSTETYLYKAVIRNRALNNYALQCFFLSDYDLGKIGSNINDMKRIIKIPEEIVISMEFDGTIHYGGFSTLDEM